MAKTSSEFNWRVVAQRAVGSYPVVALSPALDLLPGILHAEKPVLIEALFPEPSIERLDVGVVDRFAWPTEVELDPIEVRPLVDDLRRELATVVAADGCRQPSSYADQLSTNVNSRIAARLNRASDMKSMLHRWFLLVRSGRAERTLQATRRLGVFLRISRPSAR